ncbi:MAG: TerB family tellurite resistance protein [Alphaproteobacteria bacterium]|nr:TerB family tellurite resistance protein [Alphaproteobacteria bacterium]
MEPEKGISDSQFYMWRTLFAVAHADNVVTDEEVRYMAEVLEDIPFSADQRAILTEDSKHAQSIEEMFKGITDVRDQAAFFQYARELVHIDGDYGEEEQGVMLKLGEIHLKNANLDDLIGSVSLELEEDFNPDYEETGDSSRPFDEQRNLKKKIFSFRERFLKDRFGKS